VLGVEQTNLFEFWQTIWSQKIESIVMLYDLNEHVRHNRIVNKHFMSIENRCFVLFQFKLEYFRSILARRILLIDRNQ
jgi:hypothetical protein